LRHVPQPDQHRRKDGAEQARAHSVGDRQQRDRDGVEVGDQRVGVVDRDPQRKDPQEERRGQREHRHVANPPRGVAVEVAADAPRGVRDREALELDRPARLRPPVGHQGRTSSWSSA
jgi:hypothetical protein